MQSIARFVDLRETWTTTKSESKNSNPTDMKTKPNSYKPNGMPIRRRHCDDPDNCTYSDCPTAFCDRFSKGNAVGDGHLVNAVKFAISLLEGSYVQSNTHRMGALGAGDVQMALGCLKGALRESPNAPASATTGDKR